MNRIESPILSYSDPIQFSQVPPLELVFLKPVVNRPPGVLLGNLIGIPRKRIHIRKSGQLLLYLTVNGARSIRACPKK